MPHHIIQVTISEGLAHGPYVVARVGFEPVTFCTIGTEHHHSITTPHRAILLDPGDQIHSRLYSGIESSTCGYLSTSDFRCAPHRPGLLPSTWRRVASSTSSLVPSSPPQRKGISGRPVDRSDPGS